MIAFCDSGDPGANLLLLASAICGSGARGAAQPAMMPVATERIHSSQERLGNLAASAGGEYVIERRTGEKRMSGAAVQPGFGGHAAHVSGKWGWFVALGIVMLLAGIFALGDTVLVTIISVIFIGASLLVGGAFQIIHAFMTKTWSAFAFGLLCGILYVVAGLLIIQEPVQGSLVITIFLAVALVVGGVFRVIIGFRHRELPGWWLIALGGAVGVIAGVILYAALPWSSLWLLGTIIGIELIFQGAAWIAMGFSLRKLKAA